VAGRNGRRPVPVVILGRLNHQREKKTSARHPVVVVIALPALSGGVAGRPIRLAVRLGRP